MLAASLAGLGVYWLEGKYQRDPAEIQQAYHQEKTHMGRPAAEMARLRKELEKARVQAEKPEDVRWPRE